MRIHTIADDGLHQAALQAIMQLIEQRSDLRRINARFTQVIPQHGGDQLKDARFMFNIADVTEFEQWQHYHKGHAGAGGVFDLRLE